MPEARRYFAVYWDAVRFSPSMDAALYPDAWEVRWQYVLCPRLEGQARWVLFSRRQDSPSHRAIWKSYRYSDPQSFYPEYVSVVDRGNVVGRPPIVVELAAHELAKYVGTNKTETPYKVLERAAKRSPALGFKIQ